MPTVPTPCGSVPDPLVEALTAILVGLSSMRRSLGSLADDVEAEVARRASHVATMPCDRRHSS